MTLQLPTMSYVDKSDERGYRFSFKCDQCGNEYLSKYIEASSGKKSSFIKITSKAFSLGSSIMDAIPVAGKPDLNEVKNKEAEFSEALSKNFEGMSPEWHRGHDAAFDESKKEAEKYFQNCSICKRWVCPRDWDGKAGLCIEDSKQEVCPSCKQPAGSGKFCTNCGAKLETSCPSCGAKYTAGLKFCGECGALLASWEHDAQ